MTMETLTSKIVSGIQFSLVADTSAEKTNASITFPEIMVEQTMKDENNKVIKGADGKGQKELVALSLGRRGFGKLIYSLDNVKELPAEIRDIAEAQFINKFFKEELPSELHTAMTAAGASAQEVWAGIQEMFAAFDETGGTSSASPEGQGLNIVCSQPGANTMETEEAICDALDKWVAGVKEKAGWILSRKQERAETNGVNTDGSIKLRKPKGSSEK